MAAPKFKQLYLHTEGQGFTHGENEASSAEKLHVYCELTNEEYNETGPFNVTFTASGAFVSGATHQSMGSSTNDEEWFVAGPLGEGQHELKVVLESEDPTGFEWETPTVEGSVWVNVVRAKNSAIADDTEHGRDWAYVNVLINAHNFLDKPMKGARFYARITDTDGKTAAHDGEVDDGILAIPGVWVPKKNATLTLYVDTLYGDEYMRLEGSGDFNVSGDAVKFRAKQGFRDVKVTASSQDSAAEKAGAKGSAGIEFKIISVGGEYSTESEKSHTTGSSQEWTIRVPQDHIELTQLV